MKIKFKVYDRRGCVVEAGIDEFYVLGVLNSTDLLVNNYSGLIDEFKIYNIELSGEQIFQNYLCSKYGESEISVIVSDETTVGDIWMCTVTPNDGENDFINVDSNLLQIVGYGGG